MHWFKFYGGDYLSDQKFIGMSAVDRSCWVTLLCYASQNNGVINHMTEPILLAISGTSSVTDSNAGVLRRLEILKMIRIDGVTITLLNWKKRQGSFLTNVERQRRFREKHKKEKSNAGVTPPRYESNARIDKNRIDTILSVQTDQTDKFEQFWKEYPKKELKKRSKEIWAKKHLDAKADTILGFIKKAKTTKRWIEGFIKQPTTFLNGECWNDDLASYGKADNQSSTNLAIASEIKL